MLRLLVLITFIPFVFSLGHLDDVVTKPALSTRSTFISTPPQQLSGRAILTILKRQNTCGSGYCNEQDSCCDGSGCCPGGSSCCSNGSCCEAGTLCTRDPGGSIGCCPVGQTCSGSVAGSGEENNQPATSSTQSRSPPTSTASASLAPSGVSVNVNDQTSDSRNSTSVNVESQSEKEKSSLPSSAPTTTTEVGAGTIIGAVVGGILGWIALCAFFLWLQKRRKRKNKNTPLQPAQPPPVIEFGGPPKGLQGGIVGVTMEIPEGPRGPRPYTTLLGRDASGMVVEFTDPLPK